MEENTIYVAIGNDNSVVLTYKDIQTKAVIGKNGITENKKEGDMKTPLGTFDLGISIGTYENVDTKLEYFKINEDLHWVDDSKSKFYNQMVNEKEV